MRPWYLFLPLASSWVLSAGLEDGFYIVTLPDPSRNDSSEAAIPMGGDETRYDEFKEHSNLPLRNTKGHHDLIPVPVSLALYCSKYLVSKHTVHISVSSNGQVGTFVCNFSKRDQ
ncbi:hypothetical protein TOPH_07777, partial [Tolypocladium ophioglossoides CBS 100239]